MNPVAESLGDFLDEVWGTEPPVEGQQAYAYVPVKENTGKLRKFFLRWPEQRQGAIGHILKHAANPDEEVFYSPALFKSMDPKQDNVLGSRVVWADFDGNAPLEWDSDVVPQPTLEVQSSTERKRHVYWLLDDFLDDPKKLEKINRSIAYALDADTSGWDGNQFLRPPFTTNRKYDKPITAKVVANRIDRVFDLEAFADIPTPAESIREELSLADIPSIDEVKALAKWDKEMLAVFSKSKEEMAGPTHDRSGALQRLAYFGAEKGWTDEQIFAILLDADDRWEKYKTRPTRDRILSELINRARAKHGYEVATFDGLLKSIQVDTAGESAEAEQEIFSVRELAKLPGIDSWIIQDILIPRGVGLITGRPGVGKTQLTFQMAADLATGRQHFIDWETSGYPCKVLFLSLEMGAHQLGHIMKPLSERYPETELDDNLFIHAVGNPLPLDQESGQAYFLQLLDQIHPDVVMIDSLSLAIGGDLSNDREMKTAFDFLKVARNYYDFSLAIVHHHRKKANDAQSKKVMDQQSDIYGSYIITASIDFALNLEEFGNDRENGELTMNLLKNRYAAPIQPFKVARSEKLHFSRNEVSFSSSLLGDDDVS